MTAMRTSVPRVRSVRFKDGRELRVFRSRSELEAAKIASLLKEAHACYQNLYRTDMAGYVLIVWDTEGRSTSAHHVGQDSHIGQYVLPLWAAEKLRRSMGEADAVEVVRRAFNLPDGSA